MVLHPRTPLTDSVYDNFEMGVMKRTPISRGTKTLKRSGFKARKIGDIRNVAQVGKDTAKRTTAPRKGTHVKSKSLAKLKKDLDHYFSQFIRLKHANDNGEEPCYTCGKVKHWKEQQCGHFISRQYLVTRWNEDNCRPQCAGCNLFGNGQLLDFEENLKRELGEEHVELMKKSRHAILKLDRVWYETEIAFYKKRVTEML
jgi:hypothetical protein